MFSTKLKLPDFAGQIKNKIPFDALFREYYPDNVHSNGLGLCPWHDDRNPSLSLRKEAGLCHGACSNGEKPKPYDVFDLHRKRYGVGFQAACDALAERCGISASSEPKSKSRVVEEYFYRDEAGATLFKVQRKEPKSFVQCRPGSDGTWTYKLGNVRRALYRLPKVLASDPAQPVLFVEGEKDCHSAEALGFTATTVPGGANQWKSLVKNHAIHEPLKDRVVWIFPANATPRKEFCEGGGATLAGLAKEVKVLFLPALEDKQDLTDFVTIHGLDQAKRLLEEIAEKTPEFRSLRTGPEIISCRELIESDIKPPQWIIPDLLSEGLGLLVAKPKAGKSWLCQNLALSIASGTKALGRFPTKRSTTLNLCLEDNRRRMKERLSMMLKDSQPPENHLIACEWPPFDKGGLDHLHKILDTTPDIKLITIDTFGRFRPRRGRTDDVYSADYADLQQLHSLAALFGIGILLVHHLRKETSEDLVDGILGSTALSGAADNILILKRKSRGDADAVLYISGRDLPDQEYALSFDKGVWSYQGNPFDLRLTAERREIREVLLEAHKPLGIQEIATAIGKTYGAIKQNIYRMVDQGELEKAIRGKYQLPPDDKNYGEPWKAGEHSDSGEEAYLDHI